MVLFGSRAVDNFVDSYVLKSQNAISKCMSVLLFWKTTILEKLYIGRCLILPLGQSGHSNWCLAPSVSYCYTVRRKCIFLPCLLFHSSADRATRGIRLPWGISSILGQLHWISDSWRGSVVWVSCAASDSRWFVLQISRSDYWPPTTALLFHIMIWKDRQKVGSLPCRSCCGTDLRTSRHLTLEWVSAHCLDQFNWRTDRCFRSCLDGLPAPRWSWCHCLCRCHSSWGRELPNFLWFWWFTSFLAVDYSCLTHSIWRLLGFSIRNRPICLGVSQYVYICRRMPWRLLPQLTFNASVSFYDGSLPFSLGAVKPPSSSVPPSRLGWSHSGS